MHLRVILNVGTHAMILFVMLHVFQNVIRPYVKFNVIRILHLFNATLLHVTLDALLTCVKVMHVLNVKPFAILRIVLIDKRIRNMKDVKIYVKQQIVLGSVQNRQIVPNKPRPRSTPSLHKESNERGSDTQLSVEGFRS